MHIINWLNRQHKVLWLRVLHVIIVIEMDFSDDLQAGSDIHSELSSIKSSLQEVLRYLSDAQTEQASLSSRVSRLESLQRNRSHSRESGNCRWLCPVCWKPFAHRESFKGHIRRLTEAPTDQMHCFLDEEKPEHRVLLSHPRYGDGDFRSRAAAFSEQLYNTVKSNSNSTRTSASSHSAVSYVMFTLISIA